jgi:hypothetical protein
MIEFNKELAILSIEAGLGYVITRSGLRVEVIDWEHGNNSMYPILGKIQGEIRSWAINGQYVIGTLNEESKIDLCLELEFDYEIAQLVLLSNTGQIITKDGKKVIITEFSENMIFGKYFLGTSMYNGCWNRDGKSCSNIEDDDLCIRLNT